MFLIDDYSPRHTVEMRDELIVPYLITRFYTAGENKTIHDPDFMQTFKRAYLHVNAKGVSEPYMRHPLGDVYKEQDNLIILETNIAGKTTNGSKRHCHNCKTTSTPCELVCDHFIHILTMQTGVVQNCTTSSTAATRVDCMK